MPSVSKFDILLNQPWENDSYFLVPRGHDKWIIIGSSDTNSKWVCRTHGKPRKHGFQPLHRSFPLGDVSCLSTQRITIVFPESSGHSTSERMIFIDKYTEVDSDVGRINYKWKGYTFFKVKDSSCSGSCSSDLPNDLPVVAAADSDQVARTTHDLNDDGDDESDDGFEVIH